MFSIGRKSLDSVLVFSGMMVIVKVSIFDIRIIRMLRTNAAFRAPKTAPANRLKMLKAIAFTNFSVSVATR